MQTPVARTVLLADEDGAFARELAEALRGGGYVVEWLDCPEALVKRIRASPPALLIWSVRMEMDTFKELDLWRPSSRVASIPQIRMGPRTADASASGRLERMPQSIPLFIGFKPLSINVVVSAVREVLALR